MAKFPTCNSNVLKSLRMSVLLHKYAKGALFPHLYICLRYLVYSRPRSVGARVVLPMSRLVALFVSLYGPVIILLFRLEKKIAPPVRICSFIGGTCMMYAKIGRIGALHQINSYIFNAHFFHRAVFS